MHLIKISKEIMLEFIKVLKFISELCSEVYTGSRTFLLVLNLNICSLYELVFNTSNGENGINTCLVNSRWGRLIKSFHAMSEFPLMFLFVG